MEAPAPNKFALRAIKNPNSKSGKLLMMMGITLLGTCSSSFLENRWMTSALITGSCQTKLRARPHEEPLVLQHLELRILFKFPSLIQMLTDVCCTASRPAKANPRLVRRAALLKMKAH
ncbi:hypothetical protein K469DRAFT_711428 [Zopfia rhizophila CBS 207.26]|uniref:Uncharacterized protein n=1 Tax=Zopfia rhizophila CBS 207.26 TaxID=1314779 RepID=A0A6A6DWK3_9PEZI|nr:hypothetical protein K469DRAFT_711428 [Zopfia rhizophila CBS 207.26]